MFPEYAVSRTSWGIGGKSLTPTYPISTILIPLAVCHRSPGQSLRQNHRRRRYRRLRHRVRWTRRLLVDRGTFEAIRYWKIAGSDEFDLGAG